ncbi:MAG: glucose-6-phosphate isomerase, partial [Pseudomonadales bacterium]|nr:glucose-6-phosphate isomerase [Pseudomonadales bacterium]
MTDITQTPYWQSLSEDAARMAGTRMTSLFEADSGRSSRYRIESGPIMLDYSKNLLDDTTLANLGKLFEASGLNARREAMFRGEQVNNTEERAALHTLLRARPDDLDPENSANFTAVTSTLRQMERISSAVRSGEWKGASGKPVRTVIHLGIGGSYLGPHMVDEALSPYRDSNSPECHYVANVDGIHIDQVLRQCDPASTLIIVVSKSFTTLETRLNANAARSWLLNAIDEGDLHHHLVGVTSNIEAALTYGIAEENLLPMWDWVGGRYSVWSAVGLPLAIRYGFEAFSELLSGARAMDQHFRTAAFPDNLPMMLAGIGVFYHNFMDCASHAVLTYDHTLRLLPDHLQQLDMESNGKSVDVSGDPVAWQTGPVIWGGEGTNGQHAFHQLLHQGTRLTSLDFIQPINPHHDRDEQH